MTLRGFPEDQAMARLRRSKRIATSAAKKANQSGALPAFRSAMDSRGTVNAEAWEEQEKSGVYPGKTSMKRPAPVEDVFPGVPNLTRRRQKTGLKAPRKLEDQAYKPLAEEESEGLDTDQTTAPKKAKARKSVRFEDLSDGRLQKGTHRRPRREYKEFPWGDDLEEGFSFGTSDSDVQDFVAGGSQVKDGNSRDQMVENEVNHSWRITRLQRRTDDVE